MPLRLKKFHIKTLLHQAHPWISLAHGLDFKTIEVQSALGFLPEFNLPEEKKCRFLCGPLTLKLKTTY
jgi:hypothetical protein